MIDSFAKLCNSFLAVDYLCKKLHYLTRSQKKKKKKKKIHVQSIFCMRLSGKKLIDISGHI